MGLTGGRGQWRAGFTKKDDSTEGVGLWATQTRIPLSLWLLQLPLLLKPTPRVTSSGEKMKLNHLPSQAWEREELLMERLKQL